MTFDVEIETANDVLVMAVKALGGSKKVGLMLWPDQPLDHAQRKLLDCLDVERLANLKPDQAMLLLRLCRDAGDAVPMAHWCRLSGFEAPAMLANPNTAAELQRHVVALSAQVALLLAQIQGVSQ